jgi:hypothetical protein
VRTGLEATTAIHGGLAAAGLSRDSPYTGGEIVGWTEAYGSTGFSVREEGGGRLAWHVVVSGRAHLEYDEYKEDGDGLHRPVHPEGLCPRIGTVFEAEGLVVISVRCSGHQTMWDDDVNYEIVTARPDWLEGKPAGRRHIGRH